MAVLLVETRFEELPARSVVPAAEGLLAGLLGLLDGVPHGPSRVFSTPRRLCAVIEGLADARPVVEELVTGPPLSAARSEDGWTRAGLGFARARGVDPDSLEVVDGPRGPAVAVRVRRGGETVSELVARGLERAVLDIPFPRTMRWGAGDTRLGRPLHQVVAVLDGRRIPATVAGIQTTGRVQGHRLSPLGPAPVTSADDYLAALSERWVMADRAARREAILRGLRREAERQGVRAVVPGDLLDEVTDLVEWPVVLAGRFDPELLDLPPRLLQETMRVHQRTFPTTRDGRLTDLFLVVSNSPQGDAELIARGNARVLAARFHDARFFFAEDLRDGLDACARAIEDTAWVRRLGSLAEKQRRVSALGASLAALFDAPRATVARAGALCKADLASRMVGEFPELQGHIGRLYAERQGETPEVALAIEEHYLPRFAGDRLPSTRAGAALAAADRLDTLAGCFAAGMRPRGSSDPQGLRRAAHGLLAILLGGRVRASLGEVLGLAAAPFDGASGTRLGAAEVVQELRSFVLDRLRAAMQAGGFRTDLVDAVLATGLDDPVALHARAEALASLAGAQGGAFAELMVAFKRVLNITRGVEHTLDDPSLYRSPVEHELREAFLSARESVGARLDALDVPGALARLAELKPRIDRYFEEVLVMAEQPGLRAARLGLLSAIAGLFMRVADFRRIST